MVRIYSLALIALSASALAATTHNERRAVSDVINFDVSSRNALLVDFEKRQNGQANSPDIQKPKGERNPELDQAEKEMNEALKAAVAAIPEDLKKKAKDAIRKFETLRQGLGDQKQKVKNNGNAI